MTRAGRAMSVAGLALVVVLAGCGADDDSSPGAVTPTATTSDPLAPPGAETPVPPPAETPAVPAESPAVAAETPVAVTPATDEGSDARWAAVAVVALAVLALGLLGWRVRASRRRWDARFTACCDQLRWVDDSLVPQVLAARSAVEAAAMWNGARVRVTAADEELASLAGAPPTHTRRDHAIQLRQALGDLATAVDADTAIAHAGDPGYLRASRARIEQARTKLSSTLNRIMAS